MPDPPDDAPDRFRALFESARRSMDGAASEKTDESQFDSEDCDSFVVRLRDSRLIAERDWEAVDSEVLSSSDARELAARLHGRGLLSGWQCRMLLNGRSDFYLGRYQLHSEVGRGGMGTVYQARDTELQRVVALKVLSDRLPNDEASIARFRREIRTAAALEHQNIVRTYDAGEADGVRFFVMEYVRGVDLSSLVRRRGPLQPELAADCIRQAAAGLGHAHAQGIIHRDVKPGNLLLDETGTVKVLDLGLARIETRIESETWMELTGTNVVLGTIDYMSPEQALDTRHADARSDIYSLGCTLFTLLTGQSIFGGDTPLKKLLAHRETEIPSLASTIPTTSAVGELEPIFQRMVAKNPADRFQTMAELADALSDIPHPADRDVESIADVAPVFNNATSISSEATARSSSAKPRLEGRRRRIVAAAAVAFGCLLLLAVMWTSGLFSSTPVDNTNEQPPAPLIAEAPFDSDKAAAHQKVWARHLGLEVEVTNSIGMKLRLIPPGSFLMGAPESDTLAGDDARPQRKVEIARPFLIGRDEVTYDAFSRFIKATGHKTDAEKNGNGEGIARGEFVRGPQYSWRRMGFGQTEWSPVANVSWRDAVTFCEWLSKKEGVTYRLPTEVEWEYACRAGTTTRFSFGESDEDLGKHGWYGRRSQAVGLKTANPFGLYDTYGNVAEWCRDRYAPYGHKAKSTSETRVLRGGGFPIRRPAIGSADREHQSPNTVSSYIGFRVVREIPNQ